MARGIRKNAKNHQRVILGMLAIQFEISFWASILVECALSKVTVRSSRLLQLEEFCCVVYKG